MPPLRPPPLKLSRRYDVADRQPTPYPVSEDELGRGRSQHASLSPQRGAHEPWHKDLSRRDHNSRRQTERQGNSSSTQRPAHSNRVQRLIDQHNVEIRRRPAVPKPTPKACQTEKRVRFRLPRLILRSDPEATLTRMMARLGMEEGPRGRTRRCGECGQKIN